MSSLTTRICVGGVSLALAACSTARISQYEKFSTAGVAFIGVMPELYDASFDAFIKDRLLVLQDARVKLDAETKPPPVGSGMSETERAETLKKGMDGEQKGASTRREVLSDLKEHAGILKDYFTAMQALAKSDAPATVSEAADSAVKKLANLNRKISKIKIGNAEVTDLVKPVTEPIVRAGVAKKLDERLRDDAALIDVELSLHAELLAAISEEIENYASDRKRADFETKVRAAYVAKGDLSKDFADQWKKALAGPAAAPAIKKAADAMSEAKTTFAALKSGELNDEQIDIWLDDVSDVVGLIEQIGGTADDAD